MKNNFEQLIKDSLKNHEVPYEAGAWEKFDKAQASTPFYKSKWFVGGAALFAIITSVTLYNVDFNSAEAQLKEENNTNLAKANTHVSMTDSSIPSEKEESALLVEKEMKETPRKSNVIPVNLLKEEGKNNINNTIPEGLIGSDFNRISDLSSEKSNELTVPPETENNTVVKTPPSASFFIEKTLCEGSDINLLADNTDDNYNYSWKLNDGEVVSGKVVSLEATEIGPNTVTLYIKQNGKEIAKKESSFTILESPRDNTGIELNQSSLINELNFEMEDASNQIIWNFGDNTSSIESNATHTYKKAGKYKCEYVITAINGCSSTFERNINVKGYYNLRTDYGFSPGKRDNINDNFIPVELNELNVPFELSIYARNGQRLYTTTSIDKPWDGSMKDGSTCTFGSYVWVLSLTNELGEKEVYKGTVTNVSN